jgi:transcriptional repressor NrdR
MRCPFCGDLSSQVKDSRSSEDGAAIRRRRQCDGCAARFTTFERIHLRDLVVIKKDGRREAFDRAKLSRAVGHASAKRDIAADRIERLVSSIQRQLETRGDEVRAEEIGEKVMAGLKTLDHVAYIRFASIYRDFSEASDFAEIAEEVGEPGETVSAPPGKLL